MQPFSISSPVLVPFKPVYKTKAWRCHVHTSQIWVQYPGTQPISHMRVVVCSRLVREMSTSTGHIGVTGQTEKQSAAVNCRHRRQGERTMSKKHRSQAAGRPLMLPPKQSSGIKSTPKAFDRILTCHCKGISFMVCNLRSTYHLNKLYIIRIV